MQVVLSTADLLQVLDSLPGAFLFCKRGRGEPRVHHNAALRRVLHDEPEGERLQRELQRMRMELLGSLDQEEGAAHPPGGPQTVERRVKTARATYVLRGSQLSSPLGMTEGDVVLIAVEPVAVDPLDRETLRSRFRLTERESQFAQLLVEGRSNAEIANSLEISPNTAHHYTERILLKLGARNRTEAVSKILLD